MDSNAKEIAEELLHLIESKRDFTDEEVEHIKRVLNNDVSNREKIDDLHRAFFEVLPGQKQNFISGLREMLTTYTRFNWLGKIVFFSIPVLVVAINSWDSLATHLKAWFTVK